MIEIGDKGQVFDKKLISDLPERNPNVVAGLWRQLDSTEVRSDSTVGMP